jgi:O-methyltransferase
MPEVVAARSDGQCYDTKLPFSNKYIFNGRGSKMKKVILFGASSGGIRVFNFLTHNYEVMAFADNDLQKQGKVLFGKPVISPEYLKEYEFDMIIITTTTLADTDLIYKQLVEKLGIAKEKIMDCMYDIRIATLRRIADGIKEKGILGNVAELGVFKGEFAKYINEVFPERKLYLFDTFEGFDAKDVAMDNQYGYSSSINGKYCNSNMQVVLDKMRYPNNCILKKGYFPETARNLEDWFAFVSIDVDLFQPTLAGLEYFFPRMAKDGYIFVHDYDSILYKGVKEAVHQYDKENSIRYVPICDLGGSIVIIK